MRTFIILGLTVIACGRDPKTAAYEAAARRINPVFLALQPTRATLRRLHPGANLHFYDEHPAEAAAAIAACNDARELFAELAAADFSRRKETSELDDFSLAFTARELTSPWNGCSSMEDRNHSRYLCWRACHGMWDLLAMKAEQLRHCAREVGVEIVSLGATDAPQKRCPSFSE